MNCSTERGPLASRKKLIIQSLAEPTVSAAPTHRLAPLPAARQRRGRPHATLCPSGCLRPPQPCDGSCNRAAAPAWGESAEPVALTPVWSLWQVSMSEGADPNNDANIEIWKIKKLIKSLEAARGYASTLPPPACSACVCPVRRSVATAQSAAPDA